jgi:NTE family protein
VRLHRQCRSHQKPTIGSRSTIAGGGLLASACLPHLNHAVQIHGDWYWDGGFSANPSLRQLVFESTADDVLLVQLTPQEQNGVPHFSQNISKRVNQIMFNGPLQRELEALADLVAVCGRARYIRSRLCRKLHRLRLHRVLRRT